MRSQVYTREYGESSHIGLLFPTPQIQSWSRFTSEFSTVAGFGDHRPYMRYNGDCLFGRAPNLHQLICMFLEYENSAYLHNQLRMKGDREHEVRNFETNGAQSRVQV